MNISFDLLELRYLKAFCTLVIQNNQHRKKQQIFVHIKNVAPIIVNIVCFVNLGGYDVIRLNSVTSLLCAPIVLINLFI